jgi:3-mercaptopyruvate sulfurtransferase SseA
MKAFRSFLLPLLAVAATVSALWLSQRPQPPAASSVEKVGIEADRGGYRLVDTDTLWQWVRAAPEKVLLVDTRQEWEFRIGHISGAVNFPMAPTRWERWRKKDALAKLLGENKDRTLVFY